MPLTYTATQARARFHEIMRRVREGRTVRVSYRGQPFAEIRPIGGKAKSIEEHLDDLERRGIVSPPVDRNAPIGPIAHRPGALQRFLNERD